MLVEQEKGAEERGKLIDSWRLIRDKSDANWLANDKQIYYLLFEQTMCVLHAYLFVREILIDCFVRYQIIR